MILKPQERFLIWNFLQPPSDNIIFRNNTFWPLFNTISQKQKGCCWVEHVWNTHVLEFRVSLPQHLYLSATAYLYVSRGPGIETIISLHEGDILGGFHHLAVKHTIFLPRLTVLPFFQTTSLTWAPNCSLSLPVCESGQWPGVGEPCDQAGNTQRPAVLHREEGTHTKFEIAGYQVFAWGDI